VKMWFVVLAIVLSTLWAVNAQAANRDAQPFECQGGAGGFPWLWCSFFRDGDPEEHWAAYGVRVAPGVFGVSHLGAGNWVPK
jgi:hypothetical protein